MIIFTLLENILKYFELKRFLCIRILLNIIILFSHERNDAISRTSKKFLRFSPQHSHNLRTSVKKNAVFSGNQHFALCSYPVFESYGRHNIHTVLKGSNFARDRENESELNYTCKSTGGEKFAPRKREIKMNC